MKDIAIGIALGFLLAAIACAWIEYKPRAPSVLAPESPDLSNVEQELLECKKLLAFKPPAKARLNLPGAIQKDPDKHVVAASPVPASDYPHTMTAVYDSGTGAVDMFLRRDSLPWLDTRARFGIGFSGGIGSEYDAVAGKLDGYWQPLKVKAVSLRLTGDATTKGQWSVWWRAGVEW